MIQERQEEEESEERRKREALERELRAQREAEWVSPANDYRN